VHKVHNCLVVFIQNLHFTVYCNNIKTLQDVEVALVKSKVQNCPWDLVSLGNT